MHEEYIVDGHCGLCGDYGFINNLHSRTSNGVNCGGLHFCPCPKGRDLKAQLAGDKGRLLGHVVNLYKAEKKNA